MSIDQKSQYVCDTRKQLRENQMVHSRSCFLYKNPIEIQIYSMIMIIKRNLIIIHFMSYINERGRMS